MNVFRHTLVAGAVALAFACGGAFAQSAGGGGNAGGSGNTGNSSTQGRSGQRSNGAQGTMGNSGMNGQGSGMQGGGNGQGTGMQGAGMNGGTQGCANQATTAGTNVAEANRPPGAPVQGAASKGSGDWSNQSSSCMNGQGRGNAGHSAGGRNPSNGGG